MCLMQDLGRDKISNAHESGFEQHYDRRGRSWTQHLLGTEHNASTVPECIGRKQHDGLAF
jgi:hypothetical protein